MTHFLHAVLDGLAKHPDSVLIRPLLTTTPTPHWGSVTYAEYSRNLNKAAAYWSRTLRDAGSMDGSVVGVWLTGQAWSDLVHLYAISRAGFVPELFSVKYSHPGGIVVCDLLKECNAKALIYDAYFVDVVAQMNFEHPAFQVIDISTMVVTTECLGPLPTVQDDDVAMFFHTSGTTSGRPKPVPETHKWIKALASLHWPGIWQGDFHGDPDIFNNMGSLAHIGAAMSIPKFTPVGACLVLTSKPDLDSDEFLAAISKGGINRLVQYASWLTKLLTIARTSPDVLQALRGLRQIAYTGSALSPADEQWALSNGIPITAFYASTECAPCMVSTLGSGNLHLHIIPGIDCKMIPAETEVQDDAEGVSRFHLYEIFVPAHARNCPHVSIRNHPDGHATADLFEEVLPGEFAFRGRRDDWIRCSDPALCDAKGMENNIMKTCADIVRACVVVGNNRPRLALLIEPVLSEAHPSTAPDNSDVNLLKQEIIKRLGVYNERLFAYEKIEHPGSILVLSPGSLPRTAEKGNVRRKAAEEQYADQLDELYSALFP